MDSKLIFADLTFQIRKAIYKEDEEKVILALKATEFMPRAFEQQLLHYD